MHFANYALLTKKECIEHVSCDPRPSVQISGKNGPGFHFANYQLPRKRNGGGVQHLSWLLSRKTDFSYGDSRLDLDDDIKAAGLHAERFAAWAYTTFPEIART